jgi:hypothetical protein
LDHLARELAEEYVRLMKESAAARKLAVLLHRLWVTAEVYEPLRNQKNKLDSIAQAVPA